LTPENNQRLKSWQHRVPQEAEVKVKTKIRIISSVKTKIRAGRLAQVVKYLPSKHEVLSSNPVPSKGICQESTHDFY
jgi:hypothetical protein